MHQTERLLLRPFKDSDLPDFQKIMADPRLGTWLAKPRGLTPGETEKRMIRFQDHWQKYGYGTFAVLDLKTKKLLGYCGLIFDERFDAPEILYALDADYWRMGYITEAGKKVLQIAASEWSIKRVVSFTLPNNFASQGVMKKLGLHYQRNIIHAELDHVFFETHLR